MKNKYELIEERVKELQNDYGKLSSKELEIKYDASYATIRKILYKYNIMDSERTAPIKYTYIHEHIDDFKTDWIDGILSKEQLKNKYHCPYTTLKSCAKKLNIKRKTMKDLVDYKSLISDVVNDKYTYKQLIEKYGICEQTIRKVLKEHGITHKRDNRKYNFNVNYFDNIDSEHKAYWLGFIYADGSHNLKKYSLTIILQQGDIDLLNEFYKDVECDKNVKLYMNTNGKYYANALIQHKHLSETLIKQGVPNNKSFKLEFPDNNKIPYDLKRHFVRGYFDGDGCISIPTDKSKVSWSMVGNYNFIKGIKEYIENNINNYNMNIWNCSHSKVCSIGKGGRIVCMSFFDWLYKDATIFLKRKYNKYLELKKYNEEKEIEKNRKYKKIS